MDPPHKWPLRFHLSKSLELRSGRDVLLVIITMNLSRAVSEKSAILVEKRHFSTLPY